MNQSTLSKLRKNASGFAMSALLLQLCLPAVVHAQEAGKALAVPSPSPVADLQPNAATISVTGVCEYSEDGVTFAALTKGHLCEQGATIRTGANARADLVFRRTGTTVRLQAGTELKLEAMSAGMKDGLPVEHTLLDLRAGRIFTVVRSDVAGSVLEIRNAAGRSVVEGSGVGRYIITADGTHVTAAGSAIPLKVIGDSGITVVAAGQQFDKKEGKALAASPSLWVKDMIRTRRTPGSHRNARFAKARQPITQFSLFVMTTLSKHKPLTLGDFVSGSYRALGKRRANGLIRLALKLRLIEFRGQKRFVVS